MKKSFIAIPLLLALFALTGCAFTFADYDKINAGRTAMKEDYNRINKKVDTLNREVTTLDTQVKKMDEQIADLKTSNKELETQRSELAARLKQAEPKTGAPEAAAVAAPAPKAEKKPAAKKEASPETKKPEVEKKIPVRLTKEQIAALKAGKKLPPAKEAPEETPKAEPEKPKEPAKPAEVEKPKEPEEKKAEEPEAQPEKKKIPVRLTKEQIAALKAGKKLPPAKEAPEEAPKAAPEKPKEPAKVEKPKEPTEPAKAVKPIEPAEPAKAAAVKVKVLVGTKDKAPSAEVAKALEGMGYKPEKIADAPRKNFKENVVYYTPGKKDTAVAIQGKLGGSTQIKALSWKSAFDIIVVAVKPPAPEAKAVKPAPAKKAPAEAAKKPQAPAAKQEPKATAPPPVKKVKLQVLTGTGDMFTAQRLSKSLYDMGYKAEKIGKAARSNFQYNVVYYAKGNKGLAEEIKSALGGNTEIKPLSWKSNYEIIVVSGREN